FWVKPRCDPALALLGRIDDPTLVAPGPEQYRRAALGTGPRGQGAALQLLAAPGPAHRVERRHQRLEPGRVVGADQVEIGLGRAAAEPQLQSAAGQRMQ